MRKIAFAPIASKESKVLILGTMPGEESLRKQQYYGHKSNQFWKILFVLFNEEYEEDYEAKRNLLLKNKIALWDVLQSCEGQGSADSDIKNEVINDFNLFFQDHPQIKVIFFASKKAEEFFRKYVGGGSNFTYYTLPSPSSANARMSFRQKVESWKIIPQALNQLT